MSCIPEILLFINMFGKEINKYKLMVNIDKPALGKRNNERKVFEDDNCKLLIALTQNNKRWHQKYLKSNIQHKRKKWKTNK